MGTRENVVHGHVRTGARKPWHGERAQQRNRDTIANFSNGTLLSRLPSLHKTSCVRVQLCDCKGPAHCLSDLSGQW